MGCGQAPKRLAGTWVRELSETGGGQVNVVTKADIGTFHGTAVECCGTLHLTVEVSLAHGIPPCC
jgi:hypothetical protein